MTANQDELRRRQRQEWAVLAALLLAVAALVAWLRWDAYQRVADTERDRLLRQSDAVQRVLDQQLRAAYGALRGVRDAIDDWAPPASPEDGSRRLRALAAALPLVADIAVLDPLGRVRAASRASLVGTVPGLRVPPGADPAKLVVWPPVRTPDGRDAIVLMLPLPPTAATGGAVVTALDADYLRITLRSALYADDMRARLVHGSGRVAVAEPAQAAGEPVIDLSVIDPQAGLALFEAAEPAGGPRLVALRLLRPAQVPMDRPLVLGVSRDVGAMLEPWRQQTLINLGLYGLLAVGAATALALLQRRQRESAVREREEADRLELALRGADLALWDADVTRGRTTVSDRWAEMLGYRPGEVGTDLQSWRSLVHPEDLPAVEAAREAHLAGRTAGYEAVYRMRHRDGGWRWILARGKVLERDAAGAPRRLVGTHMDISERMEALQALRRSEESLATTLHSIGDAVIATDADGFVRRINATGERLTGWRESEALGQPLGRVFRIVHEASGEPAPNPVQQVLAKGEVVELSQEVMLVARDGTRVPIADSAAPIRAPDGLVAGVVLVFSDVSERWRAEKALRDRERMLSGITDALPGPVSRVDGDGRYVFANAAYRRWFGLDPEQVVGRLQREVVGDELAAAMRPYVERAHAGETVRFEHPVHTADGRVRHALATLVPDRDADGRVVGHFTIAVDISDRKRAEDALRASESKSRELLEHLLTGVVVHDADGRVLEANPAAGRLLGVPADAMLDRISPESGWHLLEEDGSPMPEARFPVAQVRATGRPLTNFGGGIQRPGDGGIAWVLCNAFPVFRADGAIAQIVVTFIDISDRRRAEQERMMLERQLRESQKMESIGTLAGGIAHDFNNILAAILGNVALARDEIGDGHPARDSLAQAQQAGLRARSLVQQILAFSRREPGTPAVQPLGPIVRETLSLLRATLPPAVVLEAVLPEQPVPVLADATQLQQVLMNLATNAWHALPERGGRIEVGVERVGAGARPRLAGFGDAPAAHLWVRDDGCGMSAAVVERIFDPFFTTKPVGRGTGLGLSVVHGIVRSHRGEIVVDSAPQAGSTFHIYLPSPDTAPELPRAAEDAADAGADCAGHVLLVDDDPVVLLMSARLLERAGHRVSTCEGADPAIARLQQPEADVDVVVTDYNMPGASGLELAQRIAELDPGLPVILSSGLLPDPTREQALRLGVRALLHKENSFEELAPTVARVLAGAARGRS